MHNLKVTISARLYDHHGKLIRKYRARAAHSFLAQFIEWLYVHMAQTICNITKTDGNPHEMNAVTTAFRVNCPASTLTWGMLIGSGTDPVDINDYALQTPISADLTVSAHTFALSYPTAASRRLSISRNFINGSVAPIPIEEVALYTADAAFRFHCLDRTLYTIAIPPSSSLELTYRITVSV